MTRFEMFDAIRSYKSNLLAHSNDFKYYNKIDLGNGNTRYFYTKAEWDAYLEGKKRSEYEAEQKKKKEAEQAKTTSGGAKASADIESYERIKYNNYKNELNKLVEENKLDDAKKLMEQQDWVSNFKKELKDKILNDEEYSKAFNEVYWKYKTDIYANKKIGFDIVEDIEDDLKKLRENIKKQKENSNKSTKSPTNFTDAKAQSDRLAEKKEEKLQENIDKNRRADTQKKIDEILENNQNGLKRKEVYKIDDIISNSNEGKEAIELYIKMMNEYNGVYPTDKADEVKETIKQNILSAYNFDKSDIGSTIADHVAFELTQKAISKWLTLNSDKVREAQIKFAQKKVRKENEAKEAARIEPITNAIDDIKHSHNDNEVFDNIYDTLSEWRSNEEIDPETGLPLKNYKLSVKDDLLLVNPGYRYEEKSSSGNMTEDEVTGYHHNCLLSTLACVLRERGYDVSAGTDLDGVRTWGPGFFNEYDNIYPNVETSIGDLSSIKDLRQEMEQLPAGSYGDMQVVWNFFKGTGVGGHSVFFKVDNDGKLHIYDGQTGTEERWEHYEEWALTGRYYVLNDAEIDIDYIKENKMIIY